MRLGWERQGVVRVTLKVEELAALVAGARVARGALAGDPSEQTAALGRLLDDFDRASHALAPQPGTPGAGPGGDWFPAGSRRLQDAYGTRPLADRITERFVKDHLEAGDRRFVERADMVFLATADGQGRPSCSYKGGDPGFVRVVDDTTIAVPNYDGNGMFISWGNTLANPEVGLLFIDFERGHRMRLSGTASIDPGDELMAAYPGAQFIVRVAIRDVFPNCPRYIHRYRLVERSTFVPSHGRPVPVPDWKQEEWAVDVLPATNNTTDTTDNTTDKETTMSNEIAELHRRACEQVTTSVEQIVPDQWDRPTPCTEWDVRALVGHLVSGTRWVVPLVEGRTIAEVGESLSGDLPGDDPVAAWRAAAAAAVEACGAEGAMDRLVNLSSGDVVAAEYIKERILDLVMHAWDVARAIGADEVLDPELVEVASKVLAEKADLWRRYGALGPAVETEPGADAQTLLLAESGRRVS